jgi:membrane-bound lytic murein transglycosylase MltF
MWLVFALCAIIGACSAPREAAPAKAAPELPALTEIGPAPHQPISERERSSETATPDIDAIVERGYVRILVPPSRTHFETVDGRHRGKAVDVGVALAGSLGKAHAREIAAVFIATREEQLIPSLLAGKGDIAANVLLTFERDEQVAFAPPITTGIRELVVTRSDKPLVSLEDVGGRTIHVRKDSDHHASLLRLNAQLKSINRAPARIVAESTASGVEDLLAKVNDGSVPATLADDYIFDLWKKEFPNINANRDVAVSQDGSRSWVTRKDAPNLTALLKEFFSTHKLTF